MNDIQVVQDDRDESIFQLAFGDTVYHLKVERREHCNKKGPQDTRHNDKCERPLKKGPQGTRHNDKCERQKEVYDVGMSKFKNNREI